MSDLLTELQEAHRESPSWRLFGLCHQAAAHIAALEAQLAERVKPLRWLDSVVFGTRKWRGIGVFGEYGAFTGNDLTSEQIEANKAFIETEYLARILSALEATPPAPKVTDEDPLHLTEYEIQVLIGCSISGCVMSPDRVFSLHMAWHRLFSIGLIDRTDGLAIVTEKGRTVIDSILAAFSGDAS